MFKYAFVFGICAQWLLGAEINGPLGAFNALVWTLMAMGAAWMVLELLRLPVHAVRTLDDKTAVQRAALLEAERVRQEQHQARTDAAAAAAADAAAAEAT
jgi:hypothetical protein